MKHTIDVIDVKNKLNYKIINNKNLREKKREEYGYLNSPKACIIYPFKGLYHHHYYVFYSTLLKK